MTTQGVGPGRPHLPRDAMSGPRTRRAYRDAPYLDDHRRSRRAGPPTGFAGMMRWFVQGYLAETPDELHGIGAYVSRPPRIGPSGEPVEDVPAGQVGGSVLGSPRYSEEARQLLENSPRQTAGDGMETHYVRPMRAALSRLARQDDGPFMARFLEQIGYARGDWTSVAERWFPTQPYVRRAFAEQALRRLVDQYEPAPRARYDGRPGWVDLSDAQRNAEQAS